MNKILTVAIASALLAMPVSVNADWSMTGLGTLGGSTSFARDINDSGQVIGSSSLANGVGAGFITGAGDVTMSNIGSIFPTAINNSGVVVGSFFSSEGRHALHAFVTEENGIGLTDLGTLGRNGIGSDSRSGAAAINNQGEIVGSYTQIGGWDPTGFIADADTGEMINFAYRPIAINDSGTVVIYNGGFASGFTVNADGSGLTKLETLGGLLSLAKDINNSGQLTGASQSSTGIHAYITDANGENINDLGTFGGKTSSSNAINNLGEVIGLAETIAGDMNAFLYSHGGITNLSLLSTVVDQGWTDLHVSAINNFGQIVGYGEINGHWEAFMLSYTSDTTFNPQDILIPVPEPTTWAMMLLGLGMLGFVGRRSEINQ